MLGAIISETPVRVVILGASIGDQVTVFKSILSRKSYYSKLLTLHVGVLFEFVGGFYTQYLNFHFMGRLNGGCVFLNLKYTT